MKVLKKIVWKFLFAVKLAPVIQLSIESYLKEKGWFKSFLRKDAVDAGFNAVPWLTYPFVSFVEPRLQKTMRVFEYGSGNSSIWLASRVKQIKSVEHDKNWADKISSKMPANATLVFIPLEYDADYCRAIQTSDELFDIVIVDGRDRNNCVKNALQNLSETGVVIFDNSNRAQYRPSYDLLYKFGFKSIDFFGMAPGIAYESCTTVFYRYKNCLNI